jgi:hypothetical protein
MPLRSQRLRRRPHLLCCPLGQGLEGHLIMWVQVLALAVQASRRIMQDQRMAFLPSFLPVLALARLLDSLLVRWVLPLRVQRVRGKDTRMRGLAAPHSHQQSQKHRRLTHSPTSP